MTIVNITDTHSERTIVLPAALVQGARGEDQYFYTASTDGDPRGYLGSMTTQTVEADVPLPPWVRDGDRVTQVRYRVLADGTNSIAMRITGISGFGNQTELASKSYSTNGHDYVTFSSTDLERSSGDGGLLIETNPWFLGVQLPSTSSLADCRFYWCEVTYDRPAS